MDMLPQAVLAAAAVGIPNISPKIGPMDHTYLAGYLDKRVTLFASSLAAAKQKAVEHFKPKKRTAGLLWVELVSLTEQ